MKLLLLTQLIVLISYSYAISQNGLEDLIIERYYIADLNDSGTPNFPVPVGAVTYRIYVDLASDWGLQAVFAATNASTGEVDSLIIRSTQPFFNNEDRGRIFGYQIATGNLDENTVLLDSWFTTGRPGSTNAGVLKPADTNGSVPSFPNLDGLLQNEDPAAGIPIRIQDGIIPASSTATWTLIGITLAELALFNNVDLMGDEFIENDGALSSFTTPLQGPTPDNRILIGQFTTAGEFSGQLNLQLRHNVTSEIQQWVAETPGAGQFTSAALTWSYNIPPVISIVAPTENERFVSGEPITITVDATDEDGIVSEVEFFYNNTSIGNDNNFPFTFSFTNPLSGVVSAVATDDDGGETTSNFVQIEINPYCVRDVAQFCNPETVCIPIDVIGLGIDDMVAFDLVLTFDNTKIIPTGSIIKKNDLLNANHFLATAAIDIVNEEMGIAVELALGAPLGTAFSGTGELFCVEVEKRAAFQVEDTTTIWVTYLAEQFTEGDTFQRDSLPPAMFSTKRNTLNLGDLAFWKDGSPIRYNTLNPDAYTKTTLTGKSANCEADTLIAILPDTNGAFIHNLDNGNYLSIERNIVDSTDVQDIINGFDAFLLRKVLLNDQAFTPSVFQLLAMDVNRDGRISAGDLSQVNQRATHHIGEFIQGWNYDNDGNPLPDYAPSKDWIFINDLLLMYDPAYSISSSFPYDDGNGYSKFSVPVVPFCLWTGIEDLPFGCPPLLVETYWGIMIGDVNGNWRE